MLTRDHPECRRAFDSGWNRMVGLAADAARSHDFDEKSLRLSLAEIAHGSYGNGGTVNEALEEGWKRGIAHAMADGILTQAEEAKLRQFRDRLALESDAADPKAAAQLVRAAAVRPDEGPITPFGSRQLPYGCSSQLLRTRPAKGPR